MFLMLWSMWMREILKIQDLWMLVINWSWEDREDKYIKNIFRTAVLGEIWGHLLRYII